MGKPATPVTKLPIRCREWCFVSPDFTGFDPPRDWARFRIDEAAPPLSDASFTISPDGCWHPIRVGDYIEKQETLSACVMQAVHALHDARNVDPVRDVVEIDRLEQALKRVREAAWSPERTLLVFKEVL